MTTKTENRALLSRLRKDRRGNFAIMGAVAVPLILAAAGFAMDLTNMVLARAELQDAADSAAIAAASALASDGKSIAEAKAIAATFMKTQLSGSRVFTWDKDGIPLPTVDIKEETTAGVGKIFKVAVSTSGNMEFTPLTKLMGYTSTTLNASSWTESATESKNALSMYLVLDKSGSMLANTTEVAHEGSCQQYNESGISLGQRSPCYIKKIEALKMAATSLFDQLKKADPNTKFVRTATVAYNDSMGTSYNLAWGTTAAQTQVNALQAGGRTSSTAATNAAYTKLDAATEETEHRRVNGQSPTKYLILMTDGNNNNRSDDTKTEEICRKAKEKKMEVYGVAFMAPPGGYGQKLLSACASAPENYFAAERMSDLVAAFEAIGDRASAVVARVTR